MVFFLISVGAYLPIVAQKYFGEIKSHFHLKIILDFLKVKTAVFSCPILLIVIILYLNCMSLSLKIPPLPVADEPIYYPVGAIDYMLRNKISGNILTEFDWGEFIIWTSCSLLRVALDGCYETVYPESVANEYFDFCDGRKGEFLDNYRHDLVLFKPNSPGLKFIQKRAAWHQLYADAGSILLAYNPDAILEKEVK